MYETKKNKYYVVYRNGEHETFDDYADLLYWLNHPRNFNNAWRDERGPRRVEKAGNNWNDQGTTKDGVFDFPTTCPIEFIVYDSYGRIINKEHLVEDLESYEPPQPRSHPCWRTRNVQENWLGFREGPVPYTRCYKKGPSCTSPRIMQELKRNVNDGAYARSKRQCNLRYAWDWDRYKFRHYKSWKLCTKKRKQWM
jgi:hypothetical protein